MREDHAFGPRETIEASGSLNNASKNHAWYPWLYISRSYGLEALVMVSGGDLNLKP
jgi:hypothetical protein